MVRLLLILLLWFHLKAQILEPAVYVGTFEWQAFVGLCCVGRVCRALSRLAKYRQNDTSLVWFVANSDVYVCSLGLRDRVIL